MNWKPMAYTLLFVLGNTAVLAAQDSTAAPPTATPRLTLTEAVIARSIVDRVPQDTGSTFPAAVGQVVCWTKITGGSAEDTIHHVWFHGDTQVGDVALTIGGSPWRTWSRKTIPAEATGAWHVEIRDGSGNMIRRVDFTIGD
jgi:Protein of unknown function (DUF2914)